MVVYNNQKEKKTTIKVMQQVLNPSSYGGDEELNELRRTFPKGYTLQRYKGLGEMNADQLWETTMNPQTRSLIQVRIEDAMSAERRISVLMGDKAELRREWIENNVSFTLEDDYGKEVEQR